MSLPKGQDELIEAVSKVNKNTIIVLNNGVPLMMDKWIDKVQAILEAWYLGEDGGNAIANILFGDVNPSGKLPVTFPKKFEDSPAFNNYPGANGNVKYAEGIFVGYRYFDKYDVEPQFPFGYGLSYTEFVYTNLQIVPKMGSENTPVYVSLEVKNIGKYEGKEIVQLYVHQIESSLERPNKELKAFKKINLKSNEKQKVEFTLNKDNLAFYNPEKKQWVVEPGKFEILLGSSSRDIRLKDNFIVTK